MPWARREPEPLEQKVNRIRKFKEVFEAQTGFVYGIFKAGETRVIGSVSINWRVSKDVADLGYWLRFGETGCGFAGEAVLGCMFASFFVLDQTTAEIYCDLANHRSAALPARLGFTPSYPDVRKDADGHDRVSQIWRMNIKAFRSHHGAKSGFRVLDKEGQLLWPSGSLPSNANR